MEFNILGFGFMGHILATCFVADGHNMLRVNSNCNEVDFFNQGNSPVAVTENLWGCTDALQRLRSIHRVIDGVQHWSDKHVLVGEQYYAIVS